jgi:hypothetical protein
MCLFTKKLMCPINMHQLYQYLCYPLRVILCNLMLPRHPLVLAVRLRTFCLQSGLKRPPICPPRKQFIRQAPRRVEKSYGVTNLWAHAFPAPFRSPTRFLLPFHTRARCEFFFCHDTCLCSSFSIHRRQRHLPFLILCTLCRLQSTFCTLKISAYATGFRPPPPPRLPSALVRLQASSATMAPFGVRTSNCICAPLKDSTA